MSLDNRTEEYYKRFMELQEKLRKSEEERLRLEMRFNEMISATKEEAQTHYRKLRSQYKKFLEEDRYRQDRNERIMRSLDRTESRIAMLTAKTERFKLLRQQYHTFINRICAIEAVHKVAPRSNFTENPRLKVEDYDDEIVEKYLETVSLDRLRTLLRKKERGKSMLPKSGYSDSMVVDHNRNYNEDILQSFREDEHRPNRVSSIAGDIMTSIYSHQTKSLDSGLSKTMDSRKSKQSGRTSSENSDADDSSDAQTIDIRPSKPAVNHKHTVEDRHGHIDANHVRSPPLTDFQGTNMIASFNLDKYELEEGEPSVSKTDQISSDQKYIIKDQNGQGSIDANHATEFKDKDLGTRLSYDEYKVEGDKRSVKGIEDVFKEEIQFPAQVPEKPAQRIEDNIVAHEITDADQQIHNQQELDELKSKQQQNYNHEQIDNKLSVQYDQTEPMIDNNEPEQAQQNVEHSEHVEIQPNLQSNDNDQLLNQYDFDQSDQVEQLHDEHKEPIQQIGQVNYDYDLNATNQQYDDNGQPLSEYDASAQYLYDENGQLIQQYDDQPVYEYDDSGQPVEQYGGQQYDTAGQPIQQYDTTEQLQSDQPVEQHTGQQYDTTGELIQQYDTREPLQQQYDENQLYENEQSNQQYNTNSYDTCGQAIQQYDPTEQLQQQSYDAIDQSNQQYDANGQPIYLYDENAQYIEQQQYSTEGQVQYDENGQPIVQYDDNGLTIVQYDDNGHPILQYDDNSRSLQQYYENQPFDENGQRVLPSDDQYDEGAPPIQQADDNTQPVEQLAQYYPETEHEINQNDDNGQLGHPYSEQSYNDEQKNENNADEQSARHYQETEYEIYQGGDNGQLSHQHSEQLNDGEQKNENDADVDVPKNDVDDKQIDEEFVEPEVLAPTVPNQQSNVMDMLDTDTESIKQDTKISHDSDFDFSNG